MGENAAKLVELANSLGADVTKLSANAVKLTAQASKLATEAANEAQNMNIFSKLYYYFTQTSSPLTKAASSAVTEAAEVAEALNSAKMSATLATQKATNATFISDLWTFGGIGFIGIGIILGVGLGAYSTNKFCEEILDKFVDYYKINADIILNSYKNAANYFLEDNEN